MSGSKDDLEALRGDIDAVDAELLELLNRRAALARRVAEVKDAASGESGADPVYYRPEREAQVIAGVRETNPGPLPDDEAARLFREVISACRSLEQRMTIGFLGPEGTFTEAAAFKHFGRSIDAIPLETIDAVFREVESGSCDFGVVPIENSTEGVVNHTLDLFVRSPLAITGEVEVRIHHFLMAKGGAIEDVERVVSHQQSLAQCRKWLDTHLPRVEREAAASNAEAARRAAAEAGTAAISPQVAAEIYGLRVLQPNIEDEPDNTTRFLVIGGRSVGPSGADKTSLLFSFKDRPGALFDVLGAFKKWNINMTRIESRPSRNRLWEYIFYIDFEGHAEEPSAVQALAEVRDATTLFKILGSYPRTASRGAG